MAIGPSSKLSDVPAAWNALTEAVIGAAMEVHRTLRPGMLERMYEAALCHELKLRGVGFARQKSIAMSYKGVSLGEHVLDVVVDELLVVEIKSVELVHDVHLHQLVSYMHSGRLSLGLLLNFNVPRLKDGIYRRVLSSAASIPRQMLDDQS
ncbi:MAG TPA: GxxExxY protein [Phycisphaerales bacterium]|nr:GxxExxY protein [Phycisphaerales bacterium]